MFGVRKSLSESFNDFGTGSKCQKFQFVQILVGLRLGHVGRDEAHEYSVLCFFF